MIKIRLIETLIFQDNLKSLVIYVVETFSEQLKKFEHLGSIQALQIKYEQVSDLETTYRGRLVHLFFLIEPPTRTLYARATRKSFGGGGISF
jgi:hypothetical protein